MLTCRTEGCKNTFDETDLQHIHVDVGSGVIIHSSIPVKDDKGNTLELCEECTNKAFADFINQLNEAQKKFLIDRAKKTALDITILSLLPDEENG